MTMEKAMEEDLYSLHDDRTTCNMERMKKEDANQHENCENCGIYTYYSGG